MPPRRKLRAEDILEQVLNDTDSDMSASSSDSESEASEDADDAGDVPHPARNNVPGFRPQVQQAPQNVRDGTAQDAGNNFVWHYYDKEDPYEPDWLPVYDRRQSVLVDTSDFSPVDFFKLYFPDEAIELISNEANRYAEQFFDAPHDFDSHSRFHKWTDTTFEEISAMLVMKITMGICSKPSLPEYWSGFWLTRTDFPSVLSRNRFQLLQTFMHLNDNSNRVERGEDGYNPLFKVQTLLDITEPTYRQYFCPGQNLSTDESMIKFKGRIFMRQYMPAKPTKWGFKNFVVSDSKTGYAFRHKIYTGRQAFPRERDIGLAEQIVLDLMDGFENKGHILYMDNFYSSPQLFRKLQDKQIGACGTVQPLRKFMPEGLKPRALALRKGDDPVFYRSNNLVACAWHDTKRVTFLSTIHTNNTIDKRLRTRRDPTGFRQIEKPVIADRYNANMEGVDLYDQMLGSYSYSHKVQKWYHAIFHNIMETALVNGYIVYRESREEADKILSTVNFRKSVIDGLLETFDRKTIQQCTHVPNEYTRLKERHFIKRYDNPKYKPDCKVCGSMRPRLRKQTSFYCLECDTPLCIVPCFEIFHTYKDFKRAREDLQNQA